MLKKILALINPFKFRYALNFQYLQLSFVACHMVGTQREQ